MPRTAIVLLAVACSTALAIAQTAKTLDIYVVDVEGGNAVLFVTPAGESVLIDTGNGGAGAARDAERIAAAARDAGLSKIDHLIITHFHNDHAPARQARRLCPVRGHECAPTVCIPGWALGRLRRRVRVQPHENQITNALR